MYLEASFGCKFRNLASLVGGLHDASIKLANESTHKRYARHRTMYETKRLTTYSMVQTLKQLKGQTESQKSVFIRVLFGQSSQTPVPLDEKALARQVGDINWIGDNLNDSQKNAIRFALSSPEIALIHGPPGTGKTHTLIELIIQLLRPERQKENGKPPKLLVCGPSNISVDNIVERLAPHKIPMVRLGHPARLLPSVLNHSLDILTKTSEAAALVQDIRKEMDAKQASISKTRSGRERKAIYGEMRELRKEYRDREHRCVDELVRTSSIVLATLHGAGGFQLKNSDFDVVIIDEASQALEAQCWIPLLSAKKAILAGDHLQLPPTIKSLNSKPEKAPKNETNNGKSGGDTGSKVTGMTLETTLFDRLLKLHGPSIKRMLTIQYRMHESIMAFPSAALYESELKAADAVKARLLKDLKYEVADTDDTRVALVFYDTQGGDFPEKAEDEDMGSRKKKSLSTESKSNENEAALVAKHVRALTDAGVHAEDIAVITPYNAQLSSLSSMLKETYVGIELGSVDGFQGREKEAVILSLVRSNSENEVGFLAEKRRLNVAMTRPRRHLCVIGDSETISKGSKFLKSWMQHLEDESDLRYPDPSDLNG